MPSPRIGTFVVVLWLAAVSSSHSGTAGAGQHKKGQPGAARGAAPRPGRRRSAEAAGGGVPPRRDKKAGSRELPRAMASASRRLLHYTPSPEEGGPGPLPPPSRRKANPEDIFGGALREHMPRSPELESFLEVGAQLSARTKAERLASAERLSAKRGFFGPVCRKCIRADQATRIESGRADGWYMPTDFNCVNIYTYLDELAIAGRSQNEHVWSWVPPFGIQDMYEDDQYTLSGGAAETLVVDECEKLASVPSPLRAPPTHPPPINPLVYKGIRHSHVQCARARARTDRFSGCTASDSDWRRPS